nr:response regulator [Atopomonas sediminilitoris]
MQRKHLLIVDDVGSVRSLCKGFLRELGFENVHEAIDGKAAVQFLRHHAAHLVICDWNMPNMSGLELLEAVRADPNIHDIPFLMITGTADVERVKQAIAAGVSDYILKPFQPNQLGFKVARALSGSKYESDGRMQALQEDEPEEVEAADKQDESTNKDEAAGAADAGDKPAEEPPEQAKADEAAEDDLDISADAVEEEQAAGKA